MFQALYKSDNNFLSFTNPLYVFKYENNKFYFTDLKNKNNSYIKEITQKQAWKQLKDFHKKEKIIFFGYISYDFSLYFDEAYTFNHITQEKLLNFPDLFFVAYSSINKFFLPSPPTPLLKERGVITNLIQDHEYKKIVLKAIEEIKNGNVYEINLSRAFLFSLTPNPSPKREGSLLNLFNYLYSKNQAPYSSFFQISKNQSILSFSPECFLKKIGQRIATFPIKGTRKRLKERKQNEEIKKELLKSEKELAEHLMVVDLERNDMSKICIPKSVKVKDFSKLHSFDYVHHLISEINGILKEKIDIFDTLEALLPGGSISGAPKIKVLELINKFEKYKRGVYTGCLGYIDSEANAEFSIIIRTLFQENNQFLLNVGGGIVFDSDPDFENQETYIKANSFIKAFKGVAPKDISFILNKV